MSRRVFIIDDEEVAMEVEKMLRIKEKQHFQRSFNKVSNYPNYQTEEYYGGCGSVGCGSTPSYSMCGISPRSYGCGGGRRRQLTYGCGAMFSGC